MASVLRPAAISRQACSLVSSRTALLQQASRTRISETLRTSYLLRESRCLSTTQRKSPSRIPSNDPVAAPFHTSARRQILPPGPQVIEGGVNDPAPVPPTSPTHGSYHWVFERAMSAALIPLTIAPFAAGSLNPVMDALLCAGIIIHSHIGFQSSIIDYVPDKRLPKTRAFFWWALRAATVVVAIGFFEFETNDVGVTEAIKKIWTAKRKEDSYVEPVLRGVT